MQGIGWLYENKSHGYAICVCGCAVDGRTRSIQMQSTAVRDFHGFCGSGV